METTAQDSTNNTETATKQIAWWKCGTWVDDVEGAQLCDDMEPPMFGNNKHQVIEVRGQIHTNYEVYGK